MSAEYYVSASRKMTVMREDIQGLLGIEEYKNNLKMTDHLREAMDAIARCETGFRAQAYAHLEAIGRQPPLF